MGGLQLQHGDSMELMVELARRQEWWAKLDTLQEAARARNVELSIHQVASGAEIAAAIPGIALRRIGRRIHQSGHHPCSMAIVSLLWTRVAVLRLPTMYQWPETAEEGGFIAYGPRFSQIFRELVAPIMVKLLRGAKPADMPVEQPTKFELVINLKTAKALGLAIPELLLIRADELIE